MKWFSLIAVVIMAMNCYAAELMCPTTFQIIRTGDSFDTVVQKCGFPQEQKQIKPPKDTAQPIGEIWTYKLYSDASELILEVYIDQGKIKTITVNGYSLLKNDTCGDIIAIGDSRDKLQDICGTPKDIYKVQPDKKPQQKEKTQVIYQTNEYQNKIYLTFEDGILIDIKD